MDMPPEIAAALTAAQPEGFEVWPENMAIVTAFLAIATQWRTISLADGRVVWQGLDYTAVDRGLDRAGIALTPAQWAGLQVIESSAAAAMNGR